ncbi:MAG: TlpA family protein disulfide reductase [Exiguobacterium profundum]|nr:MAG: TlpA family protein disulfide reductase [Exiguobacterium profundum]
MRLMAVLYTALLLGANPVAADVPAAMALRAGDMQKLAPTQPPAALPATGLLDMQDQARSLDDYRGKWVVLNFWATWCAPAGEMPSLDRLQAAMPDIAVVPVATGRNDPAAIDRFFAEAGVKGLTVLRDPKSQLARAIGVMALPVTLILNPEGEEVARLIGDAEWICPRHRRC